MPKQRPKIDLERLSPVLREAREAKGWTLEELSHQLWERGFTTSQNKLWRLENSPPKRVDSELLLWLEKVLETSLLEQEHRTHVLIEDVLSIMDGVLKHGGRIPKHSGHHGLRVIHERAIKLHRRR
jgi:transcriptional regulator with XRE-family HTH domain